MSFEKRAKQLVEQMTLEEKVSQLSYTSAAIPRLNIPEYNWWNECLHGVGRSGIATVFPQSIGMAAMWDDSLMFHIASATSDEARAKHHAYAKEGKRGIYNGLTFWTPNINIFRDPRWGRGMETYGEDPYLSGKLGVSFIKGLQGDDPKYYKLIATAKHFAVHSGPEISRHSFDARPSEVDFLETYTPQFKMAVDAGVYSVMCAYNRLEGTPCCGSKKLSSLLRNDWGFKGYIVSDCWAVKDFYNKGAHEIVNTKAEASAISVKAGTDLNCGDSYPSLIEAVEKGLITEEELDVSVERLMLARLKLGMFDDDSKVPFASIPESVIDSEEHQKLALEATEKSIVLLKNEGSLLPFSKEVKRVAVIGPNANDADAMLGNYNGYPSTPVTPFAGIKAKLPNAQVDYAQGCPLAKELPFLTAIPSDVLFTDASETSNGLKGEYFNNLDFSGKPDMLRVDSIIDFRWATQGPGAPINGNEFCVRWTGVLKPKTTGNYAIGGEGYSGFKLSIDGKEICDRNDEHEAIKEYEFVELNAGESYKLEIEYKQDHTAFAHTTLFWQAPNTKLQDEAVELAKQADLVVLCMGLSPMLEGEEMKVKVEGFAHGDREEIKLPAIQTELMQRIHELGKPTVLVLLNGSAVAFNWEAENIPAILEAWYPGQAGGTALANIIFGDTNPSGKLPLTFYKSVDQLPDFEDYSMKGRTYRYFEGEALYPFGHGLSYSTIEYSEVELSKNKTSEKDKVEAKVTLTNTSKSDCEEVIQLYVKWPESDRLRPIKELRDFKRIGLKAGESKTISFTVDETTLRIPTSPTDYLVLKGEYQIQIGGSSDNKDLKSSGLIVE